MVRQGPNPSVNRTPCQLRWQAPSALRAPVVGYVERSVVRDGPFRLFFFSREEPNKKGEKTTAS